jgi:acyl-CoA reductase-like NAD-dependent aldehyde dehydrogenase
LIKTLNDQKKQANEARSNLISNKEEKRDGKLADKMNGSTTKPLINATCAKAAIDARKPALSAAYDAFFTATKNALLAREDAIKASFDLTTERDRVLARVNARNTYKKSVKSAMETLRRTQKTIMDTYSNSIKVCSKTI